MDDIDENEQAGKEAYSGYEVEPLAVPSATGQGTSTGTQSLTLSAVTGVVQIGSTITGTGVPAATTILSQQSGPRGGNGVYRTSAATTLADITLTFTQGPTGSFFPAFTPIIPPPPIGAGKTIPPFPPPTPPPIGHVPVGDLVGPAVAAAGVPPSLPGVAQPQFETGSATTPAANGYFPQFTAPSMHYPGQTPAGPVDINAAPWTVPSLSGGAWVVPPLPTTPGTQPIMVDGWGPPGPQGGGEWDGGWVNPPGAGLPYVGSVQNRHEEFSQRPAGTVFPGDDPAYLHQPQPTKNSRRKRVSETDPTGRANDT